jgi:flagellar export protein FliJ
MNDAYRLGPIRDARDREERVRRGDLAAAVDGARATEQQVTAAAARVTAAKTALAAVAVPATASAAELARTARFAARLRRDLEAAIDAHARALASHRGRLGEADQARDRLARARADREVIERHFERWRDEQRKRADRRSE